MAKGKKESAYRMNEEHPDFHGYRAGNSSDQFAPNAGSAEMGYKSYAKIGDMDGMREQQGYRVKGLHIDPKGEQITSSKTFHPKPQDYAAEQMSDGSMGYLKTKDEQASDDAKKIRKHEVPYIKY